MNLNLKAKAEKMRIEINKLKATFFPEVTKSPKE